MGEIQASGVTALTQMVLIQMPFNLVHKGNEFELHSPAIVAFFCMQC